jgi:hypothetical protein
VWPLFADRSLRHYIEYDLAMVRHYKYLSFEYKTKQPRSGFFWIHPIISAPTFIVVVPLVHLESTTKSGSKEEIAMLDLPTFAVFLASIVYLLLTMQWGGTQYSWGNAHVIVVFIVFGLLTGSFATLEIRRSSGLTDLHHFAYFLGRWKRQLWSALDSRIRV